MTRLENHAYSNRGSGNINSAIDQGSMAARYLPLMELVGKGIEANNADVSRLSHESLTLAFCLATRRCMNLGPSFLQASTPCCWSIP